MPANKQKIWAIRGGRRGDANELFLQKNLVAVGWHEAGDLSALPASREAFKDKVAATYPDDKPGAIPVNAGQLFRFIHEVKLGDLIAYPSKIDRQIHIGEVAGDYRYAPNISEGFPNMRPVKWLRSVPRTHFTQGAIYEINSSMSFFQIKNYADEIRAALEGKSAPVVEDDTIKAVAQNVTENTNDFIIKKLAQELKGHPFAHFVGHLLQKMGYKTRISPEGTDGGIDIIAHKDELGFEPPIIKVQVKSTEGSVGDPVVSALYGKVDRGEFGLIVTLGTFTAQAKNFARNKSNLRLIDGEDLVKLILNHYEEFDSGYKGLIPLKRVYVPEPVEAEES
jgi:restriction system protein